MSAAAPMSDMAEETPHIVTLLRYAALLSPARARRLGSRHHARLSEEKA